jgi:hypothetical protein
MTVNQQSSLRVANASTRGSPEADDEATDLSRRKSTRVLNSDENFRKVSRNIDNTIKT